MRKQLFRRLRPQVVAVAGIVLALGAALPFVLGGTVGAAGERSSTDGATAASLSTSVSAPAVVNVSALPQIVATAPTSGAPKEHLRPLSPLGQTGLTQARAGAQQNAPSAAAAGAMGAMAGPPAATGAATATAAPDTPGGALSSFDGMADSATICSYFGSGCQPPDMGIASNASQVVQFVNTSMAVYSTAGAIQPGFPKSLQAFFGVPNEPNNCDPGSGNQPFLSDPRVVFDPNDQRYIAAALQVEDAFGIAPGCPALSLYWVAVSQTSNATGAWNVYAINTQLLGGFADYTELGYNSQGIFIGGNIFNQAGNAFNGAFVLGLNKKAMEAGGATFASGFGSFTASGQLLDTVQPVMSIGSGSGGPAGEILISSFNVGGTTNGVVVWDFSNVLSQQSHGQTISGVIVPTLSYAQPPLADDGTACHDCVETIDTRISGTPTMMFGNVFFAHDSAVNNGAAVNANTLWGIVHPVLDQKAVSGCTVCSTITGNTAMVDQGYLTYAGETDTWFGVLAPDREGNLVLAFEYASETFGQVPPSSAYIARRSTFPSGANWPDSGFFLAQSASTTADSRWGDYEAVGFTGWGGGALWFGTEYTAANHDWVTRISKVFYTGPWQQ